MYIVRDIFQLKFGHFKDAKQLFDNMPSEKMMPEAANISFSCRLNADYGITGSFLCARHECSRQYPFCAPPLPVLQ